MTRAEIVEKIAREGLVEALVQNVAHSPLTEDLKDLAQMIYLILLEYDEDKIIDLWEHKQMRFFIVRIIINQTRTKHSPWYDAFVKPRLRAVSVSPGNRTVINEETGEISHEYDGTLIPGNQGRL